jgi:hypothetical protein
MRFCRSLATWLVPPLPWALSVALQLPTAELAPVLDVDPVLSEPELSDWAWSAAIMLCRNSWSASAAVVASELEDAEEDDVEDEVGDVDPVAVLSVPESVALVDVVLPTPMVCNASMMAPIKPPPGGGGGGAPVAEVASLLFDPVDWL